jgi:hypothetical protein
VSGQDGDTFRPGKLGHDISFPYKYGISDRTCESARFVDLGVGKN